jgi:iron complex outermembrane receptor protein
MASGAQAQGVDDNAVASASDAFGQSVGNERIGIYSTFEVRGFSPVDAGNTRIEGLYFAPIDAPPSRLVQGSRVRVGLTAQGYPFPAPTGIVDYSLTAAAPGELLTVSFEHAQYGSLLANMDARLALGDELTGYAGGTIRRQNRHEGGNFKSHILSGGLSWRPGGDARVTGFWGYTRTYDDEAAPTVFLGGDYLPPRIERREMIGQNWAERDGSQTIAGLVASVPQGQWLIEGGLFRAGRDVAFAFTDLFTATRPDGTTPNRVMVIDADNRDVLHSGELRVARLMGNADLAHRLTLSLRGKRGDRTFGGAQRVALGESSLLFQDEKPQPVFAFGADDADSVAQTTLGLGYSITRPGLFQVDLALSGSRYRKTVDLAAALAPATTRDDPLTGSVTANVIPLDGLTIYGGFVRGFEEVPVAPANAANRGEVPPAIRTDQADLGLRYQLAPGMTLVAGLFSISKPYFNVDDTAIYRELGSSRNRGAEFSLSGTLVPGLTLVAGTVLLDAQVSGVLVDSGVIGPRPVGSISRRSNVNLDWRLDGGASPLSFDLAVESLSARVANASNALLVPPSETLDIGARYRFTLGSVRSLLRLQMANVFNNYSWRVSPNGSLLYTHSRRLLAELRLDL